MKDQEAVQKYFLEEVQKGEEFLGTNDYDNCVKHLTNAIAVCGQPQQLLQVFKQTLPPDVFQMLIQNLALLGSVQMQQMVRSVFCNNTSYQQTKTCSKSEQCSEQTVFEIRVKNLYGGGIFEHKNHSSSVIIFFYFECC